MPLRHAMPAALAFALLAAGTASAQSIMEQPMSTMPPGTYIPRSGGPALAGGAPTVQQRQVRVPPQPQINTDWQSQAPAFEPGLDGNQGAPIPETVPH